VLGYIYIYIHIYIYIYIPCIYLHYALVKVIDNTDIQPKISIDEISLLWLFCGC